MTVGDAFSQWRVRLAPAICAASLLVMNLAFYSKAAPVLRLVELSVCREYFWKHDPSVIDPNGFVDERLCKVDAIQNKVAWLFAADELLHFCCGQWPSRRLDAGRREG